MTSSPKAKARRSSHAQQAAGSAPADTRKAPPARSKFGLLTGVLLVALVAGVAYLLARNGDVNVHVFTAPAQPQLRAVALALLHPNKGILAADESPATFQKRTTMPAIKPAVRRHWRRLLLTTPGLEQYISGVILHEESFSDGSGVEAAAAQGIALGVKLDGGTAPLSKPAPGGKGVMRSKLGETVTKGLHGLHERCRKYRAAGASFAKWRAVFRVGRRTPSRAAIRRNAADLATFAAEAQRCGLVPIIEPELLAEGDHDLGRAEKAAARVLAGVFRALRRGGNVDVGSVLLKVAMITPGQGAAAAAPEVVANATLRVLLRAVPRAVPGIVFLSGGQTEEEATANLLALGRAAAARRQGGGGGRPLPWALSFSFGRALQASGIKAWEGGATEGAQAAVLARARANSLAQRGLLAEAEGLPTPP